MADKKILLIEDNNTWTELIRRKIQSLDYEIKIDSAEECMSGMQKLVDEDYDLLIADIEIHDKPRGMCLVRACAKFKKPIPVIIVSAKITPTEVIESLTNHSIKPQDIFLKGNFKTELFLNRILKKLETRIEETPSTDKDPVSVRSIENDNNMADRMRWVLFWVFISLFVIIVAGTLSMIFFDLGTPQPEERSLLVKVFVIEVGICVATLFYSVFNLQRIQKIIPHK